MSIHCICLELFDWAAFLFNTWDLSYSFDTNHQQLIKQLILCYRPTAEKCSMYVILCYASTPSSTNSDTHLSPLKTEPGNQHGWHGWPPEGRNAEDWLKNPQLGTSLQHIFIYLHSTSHSINSLLESQSVQLIKDSNLASTSLKCTIKINQAVSTLQ